MSRDEIDELMDQLEEDRLVDVSPPLMDAPEEEWDEDDVESLLFDCHAFLELILDKSNRKWQVDGARELISRITKGLAWHHLQ